MGNGKITKKLKELGLKINGVEPSGETVSEIIDDIEENYNGASKDYVNSLMSGALKRSIVETLPVENIDTNTIYMVLDAQAEEQGNVYNEYLYIENNWELIGTTAPSGTEVIANPTLAGTEAELTGLEVEGTKYKMPSGGSGKLFKYILYLINRETSLEFNIAFYHTKDVSRDDLGEDALRNGALTDLFGLTSNQSFAFEEIFALGDDGKMIITDVTAVKTNGKITSFNLGFYNLDTSSTEYYDFDFYDDAGKKQLSE